MGRGGHVLPKEVLAITQASHLREGLAPFDLYIKLLIEFFGPDTDYDPNGETDTPDGFMRLAYQMGWALECGSFPYHHSVGVLFRSLTLFLLSVTLIQ